MAYSTRESATTDALAGNHSVLRAGFLSLKQKEFTEAARCLGASDARIMFRHIVAAYLAIFPGLLIFLTVLSINYIGDGLRDALDPRRTGS